MKKLKMLAFTLLSVMLLVLSAGCYIVSGQRMRKVQGTYELTSWTRTNYKTNSTINYVERDSLKIFLVVTGNGQGYYVYSDEETDAYFRTVSLSYEYDEEKSYKVEYVTYRFTAAEEGQRLGVTSAALNYSRPAIKLSDKIGSDGISMSWKRVDKATDLSYAQAQLGTIVEYSSAMDSESSETESSQS